jgi:YegS/Rv2252/BmrU family lipid kinase
MDRGLLIYNPFSGDQRIIQKLDYIIERFQNEGILLQPCRIMTNCEQYITALMAQDGWKYIISSGGDGTLNFVSNIMLKNNVNVPLGIIPTGTCNDFASILNLPTNLRECIDVILDGKTVEVDVGLANDELYFLSSCAGGIFVDVSFNTDNELKKSLGAFAYYLRAIGEMANMKPFRVTIQTDKEVLEEDILLFANIVNSADYTDGFMDIVLVKNCSHIDLAGIFFSVLSNSGINNKNVIIITTDRCTISGSQDIVLSIDGEKGPCLPVNVSFINKALKVFTR